MPAMIVGEMGSGIGGRGLWPVLLQFGIAGLAVSALAFLICLVARAFRKKIPPGMPLAIGILAASSLVALGGVAAIAFGTSNETVK